MQRNAWEMIRYVLYSFFVGFFFNYLSKILNYEVKSAIVDIRIINPAVDYERTFEYKWITEKNRNTKKNSNQDLSLGRRLV